MGHERNNWLVWKVIVPLVMLVLMWPVYEFILERHHAFQKVFCHGDLLLFAALILMEASVVGDAATNRSERQNLGCQLLKVAAVVLIVVFGFMRSDAMSLEGILEQPTIALEGRHAYGKLTNYACFNCSVAGLASVVATLTYWSGIEKTLDRKLAAVSG